MTRKDKVINVTLAIAAAVMFCLCILSIVQHE